MGCYGAVVKIFIRIILQYTLYPGNNSPSHPYDTPTMTEALPTLSAFIGDRLLARGPLPAIVEAMRTVSQAHPEQVLLAFDDATGHQQDIDLRTAPAPVIVAERRPGRPKLGVVPREVTLLPRHWDWLNAQPGGASVTLRRLVDRARIDSQAADRQRRATEAADRFMMVMAGDRPGYEEATRALYRGDRSALARHMADWPADIREHVEHLLTATPDESLAP
jgi:uncharacterized protein